MTSQTPIIAVDAMGGDIGPDATVAAALAVAGPDLKLILVGQEDLLSAKLSEYGAAAGSREAAARHISLRHAPQTVAMDEPPSQALRNKKQSSMRVAINLVKQGEAHACVSAGNTGALMATARFVLKTLPGIDRPALCTAIPSRHGHVHMLDLGSNVDSKAEHLLQFAIMGSVLAAAVDGRAAPRVALLNIGEEEIKGNERVKEAARLLADGPLNYVGYVEGDGIFEDPVDVVVCDGFVGNVALKTSEGVANLIKHFMTEAFRARWWTKLAALAARPVLRDLKKRIDPRRYNGASLLGLRGIVIKSHGGADALAFANAIRIAELEVANDVPKRIETHLDAGRRRAQAL